MKEILLTQEIIPTDLANGDDLLAVLAKLSLASTTDTEQIYVGTYGNRSTAVAYNNLLSFLPEANNLLKQPLLHVPQAYYGADRSTSASVAYDIDYDGIQYAIHADMGNDFTPKTNLESKDMSTNMYEKIKTNHTPKRILSLGATTELSTALTQLAPNSEVSLVTIMGGTLKQQGNVSAFGEANFIHDPKSTETALSLCQEYQIPVLLVPLDTTELEEVLFTPDRLQWLSGKLQKNSPQVFEYIRNVVDSHSNYGGFYSSRRKQRETFPFDDVTYTGVPVHDLTAALVEYDYLNGQQIFEYANVNVQTNNIGEVGIARPYMIPQFGITLAGKVANYDLLWETVVSSFEKYK